MRTYLALFSALALLASPFFFAYVEAEWLLRLSKTTDHWFGAWVPMSAIFAIILIPFTLLWTVDLFGRSDLNVER